MKRLRRDYKKRFVSAAMAASMLATMLPFSAVAYAVGGETSEPKDISITWGTPSTTTDAATDVTTGSVELSASLKEGSEITSATVNITLTEAEADALEAGTTKDVLNAAGITLEEPEQEEQTLEPEPEPSAGNVSLTCEGMDDDFTAAWNPDTAKWDKPLPAKQQGK